MRGAELTPDVFREVLGAGPCGGPWTYGCTVFVLRENPRLQLSPGRADRFVWQSFGF